MCRCWTVMLRKASWKWYLNTQYRSNWAFFTLEKKLTLMFLNVQLWGKKTRERAYTYIEMKKNSCAKKTKCLSYSGTRKSKNKHIMTVIIREEKGNTCHSGFFSNKAGDVTSLLALVSRSIIVITCRQPWQTYTLIYFDLEYGRRRVTVTDFPSSLTKSFVKICISLIGFKTNA